MAEQPKRSSRRQKIEPLDYAEAALAPALKGMTSFLDLSPEDVRTGNFTGLSTPPLPSSPDQPLSDGHGGDVSSPPLVHYRNGYHRGMVSPPGDETTPVHETPPPQLAVVRDAVEEGFQAVSGIETSAPGKTTAAVVSSPMDVSPPGDVSIPVHDSIPTPSGPSAPKESSRDISTPVSHSTTAVVSTPDRVTGRGTVSTIEPISSPAGVSPPANVSSPGDETGTDTDEYNAQNADRLVPGRGRSKIRKCVLAQEGHSLGEEAIYQLLWRSGKPETNDPVGARIIRLGSAEIGVKINMSKKNVRQNIARLYEKLALEISENFETSNSQARTYRVFSYKQILERRRAAGMEYVLRNKGVVFVSKDGEELVSSPAYVSSPGGETPIRPGVPKKRRRTAESPESSKVPTYPTVVDESAPAPSEDADLTLVSKALNRYWTVDQAAAVQLLRECRRIRSDARAEEIAFFVQEKLELARQNRNITNPTGLILSMVPQSFVGSAFEEFRRRMERQARLAAEEKERQEQQTLQMQQWLLAEREKYESILNAPSSSEKERDDAEKKLRQYASWNP
jgi:hypothetical protein